MTVTVERRDYVLVRGLNPADTWSGSPNMMIFDDPAAPEHRSWCWSPPGYSPCDDSCYCDSQPIEIDMGADTAMVGASLASKGPAVWVWLPVDNDGFPSPAEALDTGIALIAAAGGADPGAELLVNVPGLRSDFTANAGQALALGTALVKMAFLACQE